MVFFEKMFIVWPCFTAEVWPARSARRGSERRARDRVRFEGLVDTVDRARRVQIFEPNVISLLLTVVLRVEFVGGDAHLVSGFRVRVRVRVIGLGL